MAMDGPLDRGKAYACAGIFVLAMKPLESLEKFRLISGIESCSIVPYEEGGAMFRIRQRPHRDVGMFVLRGELPGVLHQIVQDDAHHPGVGKRSIAEKYFLGFMLPEHEWAEIGVAVEAHSRRDPSIPFPQGSLTALLKDADGLDRYRLGSSPDPAYFRHPFTKSFLDFAWKLLARDEDDLEREFFGR